jgi:hypothetical protein
MPNDDRLLGTEPRSGASRRRLWLAILIGVLVVVVVILAFDQRSNPTTKVSSLPSTSSEVVTTTTIGEEDAVVVRLRDILKARDRAYRERDIGLLRKVYTTDCPCLRGDGNAIKQLLRDDAVWVGASTSVQIRKLEKVNNRMWIVVANFNASPFRIETESGSLIRAVEGRSELFRFALAKTSAGGSLLLGFAAPVNESG